jgi:hypothetical protein
LFLLERTAVQIECVACLWYADSDGSGERKRREKEGPIIYRRSIEERRSPCDGKANT